MTLITALVDLESGRSETPVVRAALSATKARIESLATLYDVLGGSTDPAEIRLDAYLSRIIQVVEAVFDEAVAALDFRCDFKPVVIQARSAAPLGLILMELLTNAIKYAFPPGQGGTIDMSLSLDAEKRVVLIVEDEGVGLPVGFDPTKSKGLGMELILMLVSQLNGELAIGGGEGARFLVRLPAGSGHEADEKSGDSV
jgi:two-component sensor histidine kinase